MIKRRDFNKIILTSALLPSIASALLPRHLGRWGDLEMEKYFIWEEGASTESAAISSLDHYKKVYSIKGDVTWVWYRELHGLWKNNRIITAGLTRESEFFILKTLAQDYGYKGVYQELQTQRPLLLWMIAPGELKLTGAVRPLFG